MMALRLVRFTNLSANSGHRVFLASPLSTTFRRLHYARYIEKVDSKTTATFREGLPSELICEYTDAEKPNVQKMFYPIRFPSQVYGDSIIINDAERLRIKNESGLFALGFQVRVNETMYEVLEERPLTPVAVACFIYAVGKTSFTVRQQISSPIYDEPLCTADGTMVLANPRTYAPKPLPDWFLQRYAELRKVPGITVMKPHKERAGSFSHTVKVMPIDTLLNWLTSISYLRFCEVCASKALECNALEKFTGDYATLRVKEVSTVYTGVGMKYDEPLVSMWEDENQLNTLNFTIKRGQDDLAHVRAQFTS